MDDGGETELSQDDIGSTTSSVGSTLDRDTNVGMGQGGGIVGTATNHGAKVTKTLEALDDLVLVLGEDTNKTIDVQNHLVEGAVLAARGGSILQNLGGVHVVAQTETTSSFLRNGELITGDHLDLDTESHGIVDGLLGILSGRIEDRKETDKLETVTLSIVIITLDFLESGGQGTETTHC